MNSRRHSGSKDAHPRLKLNRMNVFRIAVAFIILLTLVEAALVTTTSNPNRVADGAIAAAKPTQGGAGWNGQMPSLPNGKTETQNFEKSYSSPFNFDRVRSMNQAFSNGMDPQKIVAQNAGSAVLNSAPAALTPAPTPGLVTGNIQPFAAGACPFTPDTYEPDNTQATAHALSPSVAQQHTLNTVTDEDWVYFDAAAGRTYTIVTWEEIVNSTDLNIDTAIQLYDSNGNLIASDNNGAGNYITNPILPGSIDAIGDSLIRYTPAAAGRFFVRIVSGVQPPNVCGDYLLRLDISTATIAPTSTPGTPVSPTFGPCTDAYEYDNNPGIAKLLNVSQGVTPNFSATPGAPTIDVKNDGTQQHISCPTGDVDWVYFDLVKGKAYSIYTSKLSGGIDTFMVLYSMNADGSLNALYSSDDFPGMGLASRIDWIVPTLTNTPLGEFTRYYLAVKDVAGHGGDNMAYNLTLTAVGNGLNDCFDTYEPDNNATQAKEIVVNEVQEHVFCPNGDTDWVKFFAKAGRVYNVYTNFTGFNNTGLDTSLFVWAINFDPNDPGVIASQVLIGQNDDRAENDLSSSVNFRVPADGYYFAEVRNAGAVGRNGLYYRLGFATGAGTVSVPTTVAATTAATTTAATTTEATDTAAASVTTFGLSFGDPSFKKTWDYADLPVISGRVSRTWMWGNPGSIKLENYGNATGGSRQVQYFDKSRMEINNPKGDRTSKWFVSNGLLAREMVLGRVATSDNDSTAWKPALVPVAGDMSSSNPSPTYASFASIITVNGAGRAGDLTGKPVSASLKQDGTLSTLDKAPDTIKLATYIQETGHNIPDVFWSYLNTPGLVYDGSGYSQGQVMDWVYVMGLPLSEPVWVRATVGGVEKDVMVQVFERRILTYTPSNSAQWQVEMGNVGQHYFMWRYGQPLGRP